MLSSQSPTPRWTVRSRDGPYLRPKVISNYGVGVNHIDLDAASARGIPVGNTPGVLNEATADMAMALMLACARRLGEADHYSKSGQWKRYENMTFLGQDVTKSTVGIVGMGRIGYEVARKCKLGFDCEVLYHNRSRRPECEAELGCVYVSLDELLSRSDTVIVSSCHRAAAARTLLAVTCLPACLFAQIVTVMHV